MVVSLGGGHLLWEGVIVSVIAEALEALAFELGELDAVGGVADVEVKDGPDEGEAAGFAAAGASTTGCRSSRRVRRLPAA